MEIIKWFEFQSGQKDHALIWEFNNKANHKQH